MSDQTPQNYPNHSRLDPPFHFFALPVMAITLLLAIWNLIQHPHFAAAWGVVFMMALIVVTLKTRLNALRVQDRLIRLEERLRLAGLLPESLRSRVGDLTESQLIALRFASDAEIPDLVEKTLAGNLAGADIKKAIVNWRPDYFRV